MKNIFIYSPLIRILPSNTINLRAEPNSLQQRYSLFYINHMNTYTYNKTDKRLTFTYEERKFYSKINLINSPSINRNMILKSGLQSYGEMPSRCLHRLSPFCLLRLCEQRLEQLVHLVHMGEQNIFLPRVRRFFVLLLIFRR